MKRTLAPELGSKWGRLTFVGMASEEATRAANPRTQAPLSSGNFVCECGAELIRPISKVLCGNTRSCGCYGKQRRAEAVEAQKKVVGGYITSRHPLLRTWSSMVQRCTNPNRASWDNYGGRGISVCAEWRDFGAFVAYIEAELGPRPRGMTLDRWPNPDGDYEPGNVRWASHIQQCHNQRRVLNNSLVFEGEKLARPEVARRLGISHSALRQRMRAWPEEHWFEPAGFVYVPREERHAKAAKALRLRTEASGEECVTALAEAAGLPPHLVFGRKYSGWPRELWLKPPGFKYQQARYIHQGASLTVQEIAASLGVSESTVRRRARLGELQQATAALPQQRKAQQRQQARQTVQAKPAKPAAKGKGTKGA